MKVTSLDLAVAFYTYAKELPHRDDTERLAALWELRCALDDAIDELDPVTEGEA